MEPATFNKLFRFFSLSAVFVKCSLFSLTTGNVTRSGVAGSRWYPCCSSLISIVRASDCINFHRQLQRCFGMPVPSLSPSTVSLAPLACTTRLLSFRIKALGRRVILSGLTVPAGRTSHILACMLVTPQKFGSKGHPCYSQIHTLMKCVVARMQCIIKNASTDKCKIIHILSF